MRFVKAFCIAMVFCSFTTITSGSTTYEKALFEVTVSLLKELKYMNQLDGKTIAVCGFHDANTEKGCRPLSLSLANQIDSHINEIKSLLNADLRTVPRHALDAIETEYLIYKGGSDRDILSLLKSSDILITGMWQDQGTFLNLTIKAVAIKDNDIDQLSAVSKKIEKMTIPEKLQECLQIRPGSASMTPQTVRNKVKISFFSASISNGQLFSTDDSKPAPDAYILIKGERGNTLFSSGQHFVKNLKYGTLLKNRNNYHPHFQGLSYCHDFSTDRVLKVYLVDYDGIEGLMGSKKSSDDVIGSPYLIREEHPLGASLILTDGWEMEIEMVRLK